MLDVQHKQKSKKLEHDERHLSPNHEFGTRMSTYIDRNHVVHAAGNSTRDCTDIERYRKTRPSTSCHQNSGANLDTCAKDQRLVSLQYYVSQKKLIEVFFGAGHVLGLEREAEFSK